VIVACTAADHAAYKAANPFWLRRWVDWPEARARMADCPLCGSSLLMPYLRSRSPRRRRKEVNMRAPG
jgi:hypothetical protein